MAVFYFHLRHGTTVFEDKRGVHLPTLTDAVAHGEHDARLMVEDYPDLDRATHWIEIADERGNVVRTVPFATLAN